ncbi:helix-turn-helix domain-containing protein [Tamaricihabitans halophyticus]|uniref:helix-turn-helix domain-containing protein n=1 Tax=Tamaricihabitans halophyticus TaxID=1262583 RepID=UPI00140489E6|nr:XRE family transcriptional regulator [Tamaricihabitans halophyticus]
MVDSLDDRSDSARVTLATNIRRLRRLRGLSSAELARQSKVGSATLSGLESGTGNPRLETLIALSATLGVPLTELLDGASRPPVTVVRASQGAHVSRSNLDLRFVHRFTAGGLDVVEFYEMTVTPGDPHLSQGHAGIENILVVDGRLRVGPTDDAAVLDAGDFVSFSADGPHVYAAENGRPVHAVLALRHSAEPRTAVTDDSAILAFTEE